MKNGSAVVIDKHVVLTIITSMVIAFLVLAFRYKNDEPYTPVKILVKEGRINVGELLRFTAQAKGISKKNLVWDFGDTSMLKGTGDVVTHTYTAPGKYDVTLTIDGNYREYKTIYVADVPPPPPVKLPQPTFTYPLTATIGDLIFVEDSTPNAVSWEWEFGETGSIDATTQKAGYRFKTSGVKTISLVVNSKMYGYGMINVTEGSVKLLLEGRDKQSGRKWPIFPPLGDSGNQSKPNESAETIVLEKKVPVIKAPDILDSQIEDMLRQVVDDRIDVSAFSKYLCSDLNIKVTYNGKPMSFSWMCGELNGEMKAAKKIKFLRVICGKDPNTNCITAMTITAKKKWL